jgi:hypothetical protein
MSSGRDWPPGSQRRRRSRAMSPHSKAVAICGVLALSPSVQAESRSRPTLALAVGWESKYVSEGRDNLGAGGVFTFDVTAEWTGITSGAWLALGDSDDYQELNLSAAYAADFGPVEASVGYTRLEFIEAEESDNEIGAALVVNNIPYVVPGLDYTYATEADGGFLELSFRAEISQSNERLILEPYILEGFDFGYATSEHDGPNNLQVGVDVTVTFGGRIGVGGSVAHSWTHEDVKKEGLGDVSWVIIGLALEL